MKKILLLSALALPTGIFAQANNTNPNADHLLQFQQMQNVNYYNQFMDDNVNNDIHPIQTNLGNQQVNLPPQEQQQSSLGNIFGSNLNNDKPCTDCDEVKQAIKASHASSSGTYYKNSFSMKKWGNKFSGRMNIKMKKVFAHHKKIRTNYAICFNWH